MATNIKPDTIRQILNLSANADYIVSFYLNVDGGKYPRKQELEVDLKALLRSAAKEWLGSDKLNRSQKKFLETDFEKISNFVQFELDRRSIKGLVIFSSSGSDIWQVLTLPVTVPSFIKIGKEPYIKHLAAVIDQFKRYCTVVIDRKKARIFSVYLGGIEEYLGFFEDDVPAKVKEGEWANLREKKIANHIEDHVQRHLKNVADKTKIFFKREKCDRLIIGGRKDIVSKFISLLQPFLRECVSGEFLAQPALPLSKILEYSLDCEREAEKREEAVLLKKLINSEKPEGAGVVGLEPTIEALTTGQVQSLIISDSLKFSGGVCRQCHFISTYLETCPVCGRQLEHHDDLAEELIQQAINNNCRLNYIKYNPEFAKKYQAGAFLRFAV